MSAAIAAPVADPKGLLGTARTTGVLYLGLALTGLLGFLVIRPQLFVAGDPAATLARLVGNEGLARAGVGLEMGIVVTQALAALWFYRLFWSVDAFAAGAIAVFGVVNAVVILGSAALLASAVQVAADPIGNPAADVQLLYVLSDNLWGVGALFFGLWLLPMGRCVLRSGWMPRLLGWTLLAGGAGYLLSAFLRYLAPDAGPITEALAVPAAIGEFWMVGYLLVRGVNPHALREGGAASAAHAPKP